MIILHLIGKILKHFLFLLLIIFAIVCITVLFLSWKYGRYTDMDKIISEFNRHCTELQYVADYLKELEPTSISIDSLDYSRNSDYYGCYRSDRNVKVKIADKNVVETIRKMFCKYNYSAISKYDDKITFQLWANLDSDAGLVYSIDGNVPKIQLVTKIKHIKGNWFYYELDWNKYKQQHQNE